MLVLQYLNRREAVIKESILKSKEEEEGNTADPKEVINQYEYEENEIRSTEGEVMLLVVRRAFSARVMSVVKQRDNLFHNLYQGLK